MLETVRVLVNGQQGLILDSATERALKVLGDFLGISITVQKGLLLKTAMIYGHDCVVIGGAVYPVSGLVAMDGMKMRLVDLSQTVQIPVGGD